MKDLDLCLSHIRSLAHDIHKGSYFEKTSGQISSEIEANSKARSANLTVETLREVIEEIARSKRVLTMSLPGEARGIDLEMAFDLAFSRLGICKTDFSRIMGNLLDNAIAASAAATRPVRISAERMSPQEVRVRVIDHGCGIESAKLDKVRERGVTTKSDGQGIGLFNVEKLCQSWGCDFKLQSQEGEMTNAILSFPLTTPKLMLRENLVIVDDDPLMIESLKALLQDLGFRGLIHSFDSPDSFSLWIKSNSNVKARSSFLLDYRFDNNPNTNGLELIREHGLANCAALVTGMALDQDVAIACEKLGLALIDKAEVSSENFVFSKRLSFVQFS